MTKEWTPLEPKIISNKYYAAGVGLVLKKVVKGGSEQIELIKITKGW
jgi:hypothetical protein